MKKVVNYLGSSHISGLPGDLGVLFWWLAVCKIIHRIGSPRFRKPSKITGQLSKTTIKPLKRQKPTVKLEENRVKPQGNIIKV